MLPRLKTNFVMPVTYSRAVWSSWRLIRTREKWVRVNPVIINDSGPRFVRV